MIKKIFYLILICFLPSIVLSQDDWNIEQTSFVPCWMSVKSMSIQGDYLYINGSDYPFLYYNSFVFDISDPVNPLSVLPCTSPFYTPVISTKIYPTGEGFLLSSMEGVMFSFSHNLGYYCYSGSDIPSNLWTITTGDYYYQHEEGTISGESYWDIVVSENYAYLSLKRNHFSTVNLENGHETVFPLSEVAEFETYGLDKYTNFIFVTCGIDGLKIIDVSDPENPLITSELNSIGDVKDIIVYENYAFITCETQIFVYNISTPTNPELATTLNSVRPVSNIQIHNNNLFIFDRSSEVSIYSLDDPSNPSEQVRIEFSGSVNGINFYENYVYVMDSNGSIDIYEYSNDHNYTFVKRFGGNCTVTDIEIVNNFVLGCVQYVNDSDSRYALKYYNLNNIDDNSELEPGYYDPSSRIAVSENHAFFLSSNNVMIYDFTIPSEPELINTIALELDYENIEYYQDYLYLFDESNEGDLAIINVENPENPGPETSYPGIFDYSPSEYKIFNDLLFTINQGGWDETLQIIDVADPENLSIIATYTELSNMRSFAIDEEYLYIHTTDSRVAVFQYSSTGDLNLEETIHWSRICRVVGKQDNFLYLVTDSWNNIQILNIEDPSNPPIGVGNYYFGQSNPEYIKIIGNQIIYSDEFNTGLAILDCSEALDVGEYASHSEILPSEFTISKVYPNPFNPSVNIEISLPQRGNLEVTVFNVLGQRVATLANQQFSAWKYTFTFDGSNLASGIYFVKASLPGQVNQIQKVVLMK